MSSSEIRDPDAAVVGKGASRGEVRVSLCNIAGAAEKR